MQPEQCNGHCATVKKSGITTNMHVENFHCLLKYVYMKGKVNKRMDKCIYILLKIARDKAFERIIKLEKGRYPAKYHALEKDIRIA